MRPASEGIWSMCALLSVAGSIRKPVLFRPGRFASVLFGIFGRSALVIINRVLQNLAGLVTFLLF